jgi:hypothetical protein
MSPKGHSSSRIAADPPVRSKAPGAQLNFQHTVVVDTTATAAKDVVDAGLGDDLLSLRAPV